MKHFNHVKQLDQSDCGAACALNVLNYYGIDMNFDYLRDLLNTTKKGTTASNIVRGFIKLDFDSKLIKIKNLTNNIFDKISYPTIALTMIENSNHYQVLHGLFRNKLIVSDPLNDSIKKVPIEKFIEYFTGYLILVEPNFKYNTPTKIKKYKFLNKTLKICFEYKFILLSALIVSILVAGLSIINSYFYRIAFDMAIPENNAYFLSQLVLVFFIFILFKNIFEYTRTSLVSLLSKRIDQSLSSKYLEHLFQLPLNFFNNRESGDILTRFNDSSNLRNFISTTFISTIIDLFMIIMTSIVLFYENKQLFIITILPVIIYIALWTLFNSKLQSMEKQSLEQYSKLSSEIIQSLGGIEVINCLEKQSFISTKLKSSFKKFLMKSYGFVYFTNLNTFLSRTVQSIFSLLVLWIGVQQIINDESSIGQLLTFTTLSTYFITAVERIVTSQPEIIKSIVATKRFFQYLDYPVEEKSNQNSLNNVNKIELKNFTFSYEINNVIIDNLSLTIKRNEKIAFIGESGSGKTTLAKILTGLIPCEKGRIFINDIDITEIDKKDLLKKILYISQEPFLFKGTIKENLCMGQEFSDYDIEKSCSLASILEEINSFENGFNYYLQENAQNLSFGQRQRISLARALLHKTDVLIFDEVTSNLDHATSHAIMSNLNEIDCTKIFITHKLEENNYYDKIIDIKNSILINNSDKEHVFI
ncbi:peptidase domain-containing ABC transporter [Paenibacillus sp. FSL K6-1330]|uniref:peptidase domain-containing ABC transporter n=1 Tax=Paenibacillus sp. FSL K6-1330 TaxID=2975292 RepID=UPI0030D92603